MKNRIIRAFTATFMATVMIVGMAVTASAAGPDYSKEIEEMSKWLDGLTLAPGSGTSANPSGSGTEAGTTAPLTEDELKAYTDKVFELVNLEREKAGVAPLERDSLLDEAAAIRATEIQAAYDKYGTSHCRLNGDSYKELLIEKGIESSARGENAARQRITPENVMDVWMKSDGHRANILKDYYTHIGVGVYQRTDGTFDWVQLFITEK